MSSSDDYTSPATPFSGDETGDIFAAKDVVWQSPTTTERIVDTQSGFLVVIRRVDSRLALSVKRRLGTPPVSSILLTPDESLKLSRILAGAPNHEAREHLRLKKSWSPEIQEWLNQFGQSSAHDDEKDANYDMNPADNASFQSQSLPSSYVQEGRKGRRLLDLLPISPFNRLKAIGAVMLLVLAVVTGTVVFKFMHNSNDANKLAVPFVAEQDHLNSLKVDRFARAYISDMLDFSPDSYKVSQVQAMSYMVPELLEKYWKETNFPLSKKQLKVQSQGQTLLITQVSQSKIDDARKNVDIFAELASANSKISSPVHLKLTLGANQDGMIRVLEQKDLTASK